MDEEGGIEGRVIRRRNVIVKVRQTEKGIERQKVERVFEEWTWPDEAGVASGELTKTQVTEDNDNGTKEEDSKMNLENPVDVPAQES